MSTSQAIRPPPTTLTIIDNFTNIHTCNTSTSKYHLYTCSTFFSHQHTPHFSHPRCSAPLHAASSCSSVPQAPQFLYCHGGRLVACALSGLLATRQFTRQWAPTSCPYFSSTFPSLWVSTTSSLVFDVHRSVDVGVQACCAPPFFVLSYPPCTGRPSTI